MNSRFQDTWYVARLVILYFVYQLLFTLLFGYLVEGVWGIALGMFFAAVAMLVHLLVFGYFKVCRRMFTCVGGKVLVYSMLLVFAAMYAMNVVVQWFGFEDNLEAVFRELTHNILGFVSITVLAPLLEEMLFRGAIQGYLMRRYSNPWVGIITASLVFGVVHGNPIQIFYASCLGIVFGWIYYRTGTLFPVVLGHILNNMLAALLMVSGLDKESEVVEAPFLAELSMVAFFVATALLFVRKIDSLQPPVSVPWHDGCNP